MTNYKDVRYAHSGAAITSIPTSGVSSGTFADARISSGSITQHVTDFDDTKLKNDIGVLVLNQAVNEDKAAYNLPNAFIEQFQDYTGLDDETQGDRDSSEFWSPSGNLVEPTYPSTSFASSQNASNPGSYSPSKAFSNSTAAFAAASGGANNVQSWNIGMDFGSGNEKIIRAYGITDVGGGGSMHKWTFIGSQNSDLSSATTFDTVSSEPGSTPYSSGTFATTTAFRYYALLVTESGSYNYIYVDELDLKELGVYATGSFTCNNQTANGTVSKGGIIVLYKNNEGTATLNTDLVAKISANGGSNYETVTLVAKGTFSTGILMASAQNVTIDNTGTSMKYQISFANQSTGSKETQVHGVALLY